MKYIKIALFFIIVVLTACEGMHDIYEEYRGDGAIRYVGKITDFEVKTGWKRFEMSWTNSIDATVDSIKIVWTAENKKDSVMIGGENDTYSTEAKFENLSYVFEIYAIDSQNNHSLKSSAYGRPYTLEHEEVQVFTKVENKYFFVENNLILVFGDINEKTINPVLNYYKNGELQTLSLTSDILSQKYYTVEDIDIDKDVTITRSAILENCIDEINFEPYSLDKEYRGIDLSFQNHLARTYNIEHVDDDFINNLEVLFLDHDLPSLDAILYFPNLTKVVIGAHRYMQSPYFTPSSSLKDVPLSVYALKKANEIRGVELEIYNNHYGIQSQLSFAVSKGNPVLPEVTPLDNTDWDITVSTDEEGYSSNVENLLDNNLLTEWQPLLENTTLRSHEIIIDMKENTNINGFLIRQSNDYQYSMFQARDIQIKVSEDSNTWEDATLSKPVLGIGRGEVTLVNFPESITTRYVKLIVSDNLVYGTRKNVYLADFVIY